MTRDLRLILVLDGQELELDRARLPDDQPVTAASVVRGMRLAADRIEAWSATKHAFGDIVAHLDEPTGGGIVSVFSFDCTVSSHDLLKRGVTEARLPGSQHHHHRIVVEAETRDEAALAACQMAASIPGVVVTGIYDRI